MTVTLPYDPAWRAVDWALKNCPSYITNTHHKKANGQYALNNIDYFLNDKNEALMFILRWS